MLHVHIIALIVLAVAAYADLKTREVPDWLSHGLIYLSAGVAVILSVIQWSVQPLISGTLGFVLTWLIAMGMYKLGQWGGGDSKLLMGMGALIGIGAANLTLATFLVNSLIAGAVYGIAYTAYIAVKNRKAFIPAFQERIRTKRMVRVRVLVMISVVVLVALLFFFPVAIRLPLLTVVALCYIMFYLWLLIKTVEKTCMVKEVPVARLTEGDWIMEEVRSGKKTIMKKTDLGISKEQLALLKKSEVKKVKIKIGIPFVPSFLLAYILTILAGNWYLVFL